MVRVASLHKDGNHETDSDKKKSPIKVKINNNKKNTLYDPSTDSEVTITGSKFTYILNFKETQLIFRGFF